MSNLFEQLFGPQRPQTTVRITIVHGNDKHQATFTGPQAIIKVPAYLIKLFPDEFTRAGETLRKLRDMLGMTGLFADRPAPEPATSAADDEPGRDHIHMHTADGGRMDLTEPVLLFAHNPEGEPWPPKWSPGITLTQGVNPAFAPAVDPGLFTYLHPGADEAVKLDGPLGDPIEGTGDLAQADADPADDTAPVGGDTP